MKLPFDRNRPGLALSAGVHAALLVATLVAFSQTEAFEDVTEAVPVEVLTASEFSEITKGEKTGKEQPPKPQAVKQADTALEKPEKLDLKRDVPTPVARPETPPDPKAEDVPMPPQRAEDTAAQDLAKAQEEQAKEEQRKAAEAAAATAARDAKAKAEAQAQAEAKARADALEKQIAEAEAAEALAKAKAEARAKAEAQAAEAKRIAEAKRAEEERKAEEARKVEEARKAEEAQKLAEARKAEEAKKAAEAKKAEEARKLAQLAAEAQAKPAPPKPAKPDAKFDPAAIEKLLVSKEKPSQQASTGQEVNRTASLGAPNATGQKLSPSQRDALAGLLKDQIMACWNPPPGADNVVPKVKVVVNPDGSLGADPVLANSSSEPTFRAVAESALRAVRRCAPYKIPAQYIPAAADWKDWTVTFRPEDVLG